MEIILSEKVKSLTGSLGRGYGYHIQKRKNRFYGQRNAKGIVPADGHLRFILTCAEIAKIGLHIVNVKVRAKEMQAALILAKQYMAAQRVAENDYKEIKTEYNAQDIINLKTTFGL